MRHQSRGQYEAGEFIGLIGGAGGGAAACGARAATGDAGDRSSQHLSANDGPRVMTAFRQGLSAGYVEGNKLGNRVSLGSGPV